MNNLSKVLGALALAAALAPAASQAANLVVNGSFEQGSLGIGSFTGWTTVLGDSTTFVDSSGQTGTRYGQASDGLWAAYFGSTQADGGATISQTLATTAGQRYLLSFDVANDNGGLDASNALSVAVDGVQLFAADDLAAQDYVHETLAFTAGGASTLSLFAFNDQSYIELDDISVTALPVPEPGQAPMMLAGLLLATTSIALRRRSRS
jgi:Protein of unknown function (DUF642)